METTNTSTPRRVRRIVAGALGGIAGAIAMGGPYLAGQRIGHTGTPPPERVTKGLLRRADVRADATTEAGLTVGAHLAFGAVAGALHAAVAPTARGPVGAAVLGAISATGVHVVSYAGWVPALGLMPPPHRDRPQRQIVALLNHWLFGAIVGLVVSVADRHPRGVTAIR